MLSKLFVLLFGLVVTSYGQIALNQYGQASSSSSSGGSLAIDGSEYADSSSSIQYGGLGQQASASQSSGQSLAVDSSQYSDSASSYQYGGLGTVGGLISGGGLIAQPEPLVVPGQIVHPIAGEAFDEQAFNTMIVTIQERLLRTINDQLELWKASVEIQEEALDSYIANSYQGRIDLITNVVGWTQEQPCRAANFVQGLFVSVLDHNVAELSSRTDQCSVVYEEKEVNVTIQESQQLDQTSWTETLAQTTQSLSTFEQYFAGVQQLFQTVITTQGVNPKLVGLFQSVPVVFRQAAATVVQVATSSWQHIVVNSFNYIGQRTQTTSHLASEVTRSSASFYQCLAQ